MAGNLFLGFVAEKHEIWQEEKDLLEHNSKKVKGRDQNFQQDLSMHLVYKDAIAMEKADQEILGSKKSYKDSMMGNSNGDKENNGIMAVILIGEEIDKLSRDREEIDVGGE